MELELVLNDRNYFVELIEFISNYHHTNNVVPSIEVLSQRFEMATEDVKELLKDSEVKKVLRARYLYDGYYTDKKKSGFTLKQLDTINVLTNSNDKRSTLLKLADVKVTTQQLARWMEDPNFTKALNTRVQRAFKDEGYKVFQALAHTAVSGDVQAIKLYMEMAGHYTPTSKITGSINVDSTRTVNLLVEVIQSVCEPAMVDEIARRFEIIMNGGSLEEAEKTSTALKVGSNAVIEIGEGGKPVGNIKPINNIGI